MPSPNLSSAARPSARLVATQLLQAPVMFLVYRSTPIDQPVTAGLYRVSRHPQQFTLSLAFLGISIAMGSWPALALMMIGVIGAHARVLAEEEACLQKYGESYRRYMERVPRYFLFF